MRAPGRPSRLLAHRGGFPGAGPQRTGALGALVGRGSEPLPGGQRSLCIGPARGTVELLADLFGRSPRRVEGADRDALVAGCLRAAPVGLGRRLLRRPHRRGRGVDARIGQRRWQDHHRLGAHRTVRARMQVWAQRRGEVCVVGPCLRLLRRHQDSVSLLGGRPPFGADHRGARARRGQVGQARLLVGEALPGRDRALQRAGGRGGPGAHLGPLVVALRVLACLFGKDGGPCRARHSGRYRIHAVGHAHVRQRRPLGGQALARGRGLGGRADQHADGAGRRGGGPGQRIQHPRGGCAAHLRLLGRVRVVGQLLADRLGSGFGIRGRHVGRLRDLPVHLQAEKADQDLLPLAGGRVQELGEVALRQHHTGDEVLERQAEQALHLAADLAVGGQGFGLLAFLAEAPRIGEPFQPGVADRYVAGGEAAQLPRHDVTVPGHVEQQPDRPTRRRRRQRR